MLKLIDLIRVSGVQLGDYKIHCANDNKQNGWRPLESYFAGTFDVGQAEQTQRNFECDHVLSLINLSQSKKWLFAGVYRVVGVRRSTSSKRPGFVYSLEPTAGLEHLAGRTIVDFPKAFRASYLVGKTHEDKLVISSIREEKLSVADFPGFNSIRLTFEMLKAVIRQDNTSWRAALANIGGVYVITDAATGNQYVGSAYGGVGLWQRWTAYAKTGHGGNKELRRILRETGEEHAKNFQFSVVEVCDINASSAYVISRESHWKDVLMTREFGLNWN